jgi:hypothetical protein
MAIEKITGQTLCLLALAALPVLAHHPFSSEFDKNKPVTLDGRVTRVDWSDPHAHVYLKVKNEAGATEEWKLEMASPEYLGQH